MKRRIAVALVMAAWAVTFGPFGAPAEARKDTGWDIPRQHTGR